MCATVNTHGSIVHSFGVYYVMIIMLHSLLYVLLCVNSLYAQTLTQRILFVVRPLKVVLIPRLVVTNRSSSCRRTLGNLTDNSNSDGQQ